MLFDGGLRNIKKFAKPALSCDAVLREGGIGVIHGFRNLNSLLAQKTRAAVRANTKHVKPVDHIDPNAIEFIAACKRFELGAHVGAEALTAKTVFDEALGLSLDGVYLLPIGMRKCCFPVPYVVIQNHANAVFFESLDALAHKIALADVFVFLLGIKKGLSEAVGGIYNRGIRSRGGNGARIVLGIEFREVGAVRVRDMHIHKVS